ncbi:PP2C family protein-serine/threonine phosphatase [Roseospira visakhapatnamensis]|uniref:Sigma-B regulation protein RsbU (Phosphoserine phosphatase) n=1 Tax=Roseospira visakhapatnamensis TaxID=390880 RepID=A0A7W6RDH6_9PROT|nr:SpoIIE family protein phosphatase [Roseospira visakhapatnamensis]MBB4266498.1 sigma-B regulation protein RsbU (phosphoserine phosphatase) [Roseospira visakhapatnamensis]
MKILIVDDDEIIRKIVQLRVKKLGHDVWVAENGDQALSTIQETPSIDLVISDWMMPHMSGVQLCRAIRASPETQHMFVLLLTAKETREDYLEAMDAGADDFLVKPFDPELIAAKLRAADRILTLQAELRKNNDLLRRVNKKLEVAYDRLKRDVQAAGKMQESLLPKKTMDMGRYHIATALIPSSSVSGDIYNYFDLGDGNLALYAVDVAGHGARAAMMSFTLSRVITADRFRAKDGGMRGPRDLVSDLNAEFQVSPPNLDYFTLLVATVDAAGTMRLCQAGHPHPVAIPRNGASPTVLGGGGFPVGLMARTHFEETVVDLTPIQRVAFYSDGVIECASPTGELFGMDRFQALLHNLRDLPLPRVPAEIRRRLAEWRGSDSFDDDVSLILLETRNGIGVAG